MLSWSKRFCFASTFNDVRLSVRTGGTGGARGAPDTPNFWAFFLKWPSKHYYWDPSSFLTFRLACLHSYSVSAKSLSFASNEVFTYEHRFKKLIASIQVYLLSEGTCWATTAYARYPQAARRQQSRQYVSKRDNKHWHLQNICIPHSYAHTSPTLKLGAPSNRHSEHYHGGVTCSK